MSLRTKVTLFKGGTREKTVPIRDVVIPDMWHIAQSVRYRRTLDNPSVCADLCLDCWHIAGALKDHIIQTE